MRLALATIAILAVTALAACGDEDDNASTGEGAATQTHTAPAGAPPEKEKEPDRSKEPEKPGTEITVGTSQFGEVLFDGDNQAIYLFDAEASSKPQCYGECAAAWPPVLTDGDPVAGGGAQDKLLGTTERDDGKTQVTYAGQPLYYYAHEAPGEVLCHNVSEFGGLWLVLDANGQAL